MLSEMNIPKTKQDLIKSINKLKNIQIKIVEPISRKEIGSTILICIFFNLFILLIKLKNIQIKIVEPISRKEINNVRSEVDRFMGNESISIIMIKS